MFRANGTQCGATTTVTTFYQYLGHRRYPDKHGQRLRLYGWEVVTFRIDVTSSNKSIAYASNLSF